MSDPAAVHAALLAAIDKESRVWSSVSARCSLAECDRDRARAERHRPEIVSWTNGPPPHHSAHCVTCLEELEDYPHDVGPFSVDWPCSEYADLLADYRIKVPDA